MSDAKPTWVVGYQGSEGAYSQLAATRHFADAVTHVECRGFHSFREMLEALERSEIDFTVLPIENSIAGSINESYDLLAEKGLSLVGEEYQPVAHCLIGVAEVPLADIRRVYSHPVALAQCGAFLESLNDCHVEAFVDTAMAVEKVKIEGDPTQAAIASEQAATLHGLPILRRGIADHPENFTRMVIVATEAAHHAPDVPCKTSLVFSTIHEQGALARCIAIFAERGLNLTKIESRPKPDTPFEYVFYVDFEGNIDAAATQSALEELRNVTTFLTVLGSYPSRRLQAELSSS
ncbi:MAG: prephenate dehydratase [Myxococcota bacterium]